MTTTCPETTIYNLIQAQDATDSTHKFIIINQHEIKLLQENGIVIKGISCHFYDERDPRQRNKPIIKIYQEKFEQAPETKFYLLGLGSLYTFEIDKYYKEHPEQPRLNIESDFNVLKYLSMYSDQIMVSDEYLKGHNTPDEKERLATNAKFVETLKAHYKTSLFYCSYDTGIAGVEGYMDYREEFYKYLDDVATIYIVNSKYYKTQFMHWLEKSPHASKVKYIQVHVADLYRTNPELIAYYRNPMGLRVNNYLDTHYGFQVSCSQIDDGIYLGTDSYGHIRYFRDNKEERDTSWFPEDKITHIINVSDEPLKPPYGLPNDSILYEHYSISERGNNPQGTREMLLKAVERLHELLDIESKTGIYIHCSLGMNRSPSVVLLYLIKYKQMTLYEAYCYVAKKRRIFTSIELFDIIYEEAKVMGKVDIPVCKLRTHYCMNFCEKPAYLFALYDTMHLERVLPISEKQPSCYGLKSIIVDKLYILYK